MIGVYTVMPSTARLLRSCYRSGNTFVGFIETIKCFRLNMLLGEICERFNDIFSQWRKLERAFR